MTSSTGLKTNAEGYTTVEIKKVEVLIMAPSPEEYLIQQQQEMEQQQASEESSEETSEETTE